MAIVRVQRVGCRGEADTSVDVVLEHGCTRRRIPTNLRRRHPVKRVEGLLCVHILVELYWAFNRLLFTRGKGVGPSRVILTGWSFE